MNGVNVHGADPAQPDATTPSFAECLRAFADSRAEHNRLMTQSMAATDSRD
jgi:hypothetical protein